ncbi:MAG TPA: MBL fold metallo-hydrolase [Bacillota bacterium]
MFDFAWHGAASISLRFGGSDGPVVAVDPVFSRAGDYGPWYSPNPKAPEFREYLTEFPPDVVLITHGHFDHFDPETIKRIAVARPACRFGGSPEAIAVIRELCGVPPERSVPLIAGLGYALPGLTADPGETAPLRLVPRAGEHWLTGEEGSRAAAKLAGRPDRYGVMPCGGPMLGMFIRFQGAGSGSESVLIYVSGDNRLPALPEGPVDVAVVNIAGRLHHPVTKEPTQEIPGPEDVGTVIDRLKPGLFIPVHWDHVIFIEPVDPEKIRVSAASARHPARVLCPPYNCWTPVG